jgi:glycosyltransferase involved in cell wall biosynthesis
MDNNVQKRPVRILWLGPWHSDEALYGRKAPNQAATRWARGFVHALARQGCSIQILTHCREQYWPKGDFWPGLQKDFDLTYPLQFVRYTNAPCLRNRWLSWAYRLRISQILQTYKPDVVLSYNMEGYHCAAAGVLARKSIKWVPIILDQDDPELTRWKGFTQEAKRASGLVFLSHWGYQHCPLRLPVIHLDGGVEHWMGMLDGDKKTIVYSGKYDDHHGGLDLLFKMFASVQDPDCRFLLTGKDALNRLPGYLAQEKRATYCGFLTDSELTKVYRQATAFINPVRPDVNVNRMNFPSKLLDYLAYGKPIISTWTDGLSPEYRDLLMVPDANEPAAYARLIDQAMVMDASARLGLFERMQKWVETTHTWDIQATRLIDWIHASVLNRPKG